MKFALYFIAFEIALAAIFWFAVTQIGSEAASAEERCAASGGHLVTAPDGVFIRSRTDGHIFCSTDNATQE